MTTKSRISWINMTLSRTLALSSENQCSNNQTIYLKIYYKSDASFNSYNFEAQDYIHKFYVILRVLSY